MVHAFSCSYLTSISAVTSCQCYYLSINHLIYYYILKIDSYLMIPNHQYVTAEARLHLLFRVCSSLRNIAQHSIKMEARPFQASSAQTVPLKDLSYPMNTAFPVRLCLQNVGCKDGTLMGCFLSSLHFGPSCM